MNANTRKLFDLGQRLWLDNITRDLLDSGTLARYIADLSVTGLTSNPTIFEHAIGSGASYDEAVQVLAARGLSEEGAFFEIALQDLTRAADLFRPVFDASEGVDGWPLRRVSPDSSALRSGAPHSGMQSSAGKRRQRHASRRWNTSPSGCSSGSRPSRRRARPDLLMLRMAPTPWPDHRHERSLEPAS